MRPVRLTHRKRNKSFADVLGRIGSPLTGDGSLLTGEGSLLTREGSLLTVEGGLLTRMLGELR